MPHEPAWEGPPPDNITAWAIVQAGHAVGRRFWTALAAVGLNPIQFGVLLQLDLQPGMSNAALARTVLVTPQSMSELLTGLVEQGLVERPPPAGRGRAVAVQLTAAGRERLSECQTVIDEVEDSLGLPAQQRQQLNHLLHVVLSAGQTQAEQSGRPQTLGRPAGAQAAAAAARAHRSE